jgi:hypothetical protein
MEKMIALPEKTFIACLHLLEGLPYRDVSELIPQIRSELTVVNIAPEVPTSPAKEVCNVVDPSKGQVPADV